MSVEHRVFDHPRLLHIPTKRAAWSDRTALLMAEMSKLAYYKFEEGADGNARTQSVLDEVLERILAPPEESPATPPEDGDEADQTPDLPEGALELQRDLERAGFVLAGLFSDKATDTQAFLAISKSGGDPAERAFGEEEVAILSFRGTVSVRNWITNIDLVQENVSGAEVHSGFQAAFDSVKSSIHGKLDHLLEQGRTLYLTGHSLGGALALIATREIAPSSHGSCYTFGSPRVARFGFARYIKTPIYRVVNSNDLVPRLPPAWIPSILLFALRFLNYPAVGLLRGIIRKITKYVHHGDMRFLRRSKGPNHIDLQVLSNPSVIYRFFWYFPALVANIKSPLENHSIDLYCEKLAAYANSRIGGSFTS